MALPAPNNGQHCDEICAGVKFKLSVWSPVFVIS